MKTGRRLLVLASVLIVPHLLSCVPMSTNPADGESTSLRLSLEVPGRTVAEFSGAPILAIVDLDRDTNFSVLDWQNGRGDPPQFSNPEFGKTGKRFSVLLSWTKYPLYKDSSDSNYWDTVWVNIGGGLKVSNKVRIKVTNLPVVIDSARLDSLLFLGQDTLWQCSLPVVLRKSYQLQLFARDLDRKPVALQFVGNRGKIIRSDLTPLNVIYEPLRSDFVDTIVLVATDQMRSKAIRTLIIKYRTQNFIPFIDSIQVGTSMLAASSMTGGIYRVGFATVDTLRMHLFAHDSSGSIKTVRWSTRYNKVTADSASFLQATYVCPSAGCHDTIRDSSVIVDTIRVTVYDDRGDSVVRLIQLIHGTVNKPPGISSLLLDGKELSLIDTVVTASVVGGVSHLLILKAFDPEKKAVTVNWTGYPSSRFSDKSDSTVRYSAPAVRDTDTVRVTLDDGALSVGYTVRFQIDDIVPILDSIRGGDTVFKSNDTTFTMSVVPRDSLLFLAYARDRDAADSMTCVWTAVKQSRFTLQIGNRARYILPDSSLSDTITLKLKDGAYELTRKIYLRPVNRAPVIDSCKTGSRRLIQTGAVFRDSATTGDTVSYHIFAHDLDGSSLSYQWNAIDSASFDSRTGSEISYHCGNTAYVDTVTVRVNDPEGAAALKRIILKIDTATKP